MTGRRPGHDAVARDVVQLLTDLVAIDSVNPSLAVDGAGEGAIAAHIEQWATDNGLTAQIDDDGSGRPNVMVYSRPDGGVPTLLLCGHLDTVGFGEFVEPLAPRIDGDRLYGRGAYDMKAGLAAALVACREAHRLHLPIAVVVAAVADEEHASLGIQRLLDDLHADAAIVNEPTEMKIGIAHKGFVWLDIEVTGVAAHGSRPELGIDAIAKTGPILVALEKLTRSLADRTHPLLGPGSVHASLISGGAEPSTIPEHCVLTIERRTLPDETVEAVEAEIEALLEDCRLSDTQLTAVAHTGLHRPALETNGDETVVRALASAIRTIRATEAEVTGMSYWADSAFISSLGIPTVLFGPSGEGAHADVEWVSLPDTVACTRILLATADAMSRRETRMG